MSLMKMGITAADVNHALDRVKVGGFSVNDSASLNTYILCPVDQTLWDLKPIVRICLEGVDQSEKPREWVTQTFEKDILNLGYPIVKFTTRRKRTLGIVGFDVSELDDSHTLFWPPDGSEIINGLRVDEQVSDALRSITRPVSTRQFVRNPLLVRKILNDANGFCSACKNRAFRKPSGDWFLEVHRYSTYFEFDGIYIYDANSEVTVQSTAETGWRGRLGFGGTIAMGPSGMFDYGIRYDGLGDSDYEAISVSLGFSTSF